MVSVIAREPASGRVDQRSLDPSLVMLVVTIPLIASLLLPGMIGLLPAKAALLFSAVGLPLAFAVAAVRLCRPPQLAGRLRVLAPQSTFHLFLAFFGLFWLFQLLARTLGLWLLPAALRPTAATIKLRWPVLNLAFFRAVVGSPIGEEMLFRGWLLGWLQQRDGRFVIRDWLTRSNVVTSLAFTAAHVGGVPAWGSLVTIFLISLILGTARERSHALALPMFLHFLTNLVECTIW